MVREMQLMMLMIQRFIFNLWLLMDWQGIILLSLIRLGIRLVMGLVLGLIALA